MAFDGACRHTSEILQLLINAGGSVNEAASYGMTPLIALVRNSADDAAAALGVLLARPELDLDAKWEGKTAKQWAVEKSHPELAAVIGQEQARRRRWSDLRSTWVTSMALPARR
jgi:ankyrin repeat protein